ncbi:hypothetical protein [Pseudomonas typographi]|uniref:Uncharacterized protein n=1 Tax=Pseudomonas typographi TaxID=2715964 RepID=A0ABR7YZW5_9PSED|nr:hypothetical protein [Pseudomonas typographi]MBD1550617.1 hypothetical protein [Pseudomonas typographi]MBD1586798.1 hypothetical protein [Pseudomonas typographi]MBD1598692.1 hypothetical protein [Pseudomonas typographi]
MMQALLMQLRVATARETYTGPYLNKASSKKYVQTQRFIGAPKPLRLK